MIRGLLLAGGRSTRFGSDKLSHAWRGEPLVAHAARNLLAGAGNAIAVIPPNAAALRAILEGAGCEVLESADTARGLGASLAAGVRSSAQADGWIVALGDMPLIAPPIVTAVRDRIAAGALICAPRLRATGQRGHPVGFSRALYAELAEVDGDEGARAVLQRHASRVDFIDVDDGGVVADIDTPGDLPTSG